MSGCCSVRVMSHLVLVVHHVLRRYRRHLVDADHLITSCDRICPEEQVQGLVEVAVGTDRAQTANVESEIKIFTVRPSCSITKVFVCGT